MTHKFWKRLRQWAQKHERDAFLETTCVNLRCPHCRVWQSDAETPGSIRSFGHPIAVAFDCGQCGHASGWVCEAGFWIRAELEQIDALSATTPEQGDV